MKIFYIFFSCILLLGACKKDNNEPPEAFRGKYAGRFAVERGGINYDLSNVSLRFHGWQYDFGISEEVDFPPFVQTGRDFSINGPDKITFQLLLPTATQLSRQYTYTVKSDSLILINTLSNTEREVFRLRRVP